MPLSARAQVSLVCGWSLLLLLLSLLLMMRGAEGRQPKDADPVIVVGGGLAGLSAVLEALENGAAKVLLVDKEKGLGGNSAKATSGISACNTPTQTREGIADSPTLFYADTMAAGDRENDQGLVDVLVHQSADAVQFLVERGVNLTAINLCGGHSVPRTHWLPVAADGRPVPVGLAIVRGLQARLPAYEAAGRLQVLTDTEVVGLVTWNEYVTGVRVRAGPAADKSGPAQDQSGPAPPPVITELSAKAVVLTTGGFSADRRDNASSLLAQHAPHLAHLPTTNGAFATGDGVKMAAAMGAALVGIEHVQVHPTAFVDPKQPDAGTKFLAAEALRGKGAILVNKKGARFANELGRRDYLSKKIEDNCAKEESAGNLPIAFMVMNDEAVDGFGRASFNFYAKVKGFFQEFPNVEASAQLFDLPTIKAALEQHNAHNDQAQTSPNVRDQFGKHVFPVKFDLSKPIYVAKVTPAIHYTMGGLKIDRDAFVFSDFMQKPFKGLLAAGEASGGVHGRNRLAGNSLLECVVFGRIAGRSAARLTYAHRSEL